MTKIIIVAALALAIAASTVAELSTYSEFAVADSCGDGVTADCACLGGTPIEGANHEPYHWFF